MSAAAAALPPAIEDWTQEQRDSLLAIARRTLAGYGKYRFSREFIARHVDDFVQDALLQAWVSQQDPEAESLRVYNPAGFVSFKVVQLALDKAKGEKLRLDRAAPDGVAGEEREGFQSAAERVSDPVRTEEVYELVEHLKATKLAMAQLSERQRTAFVRCQLEGRSQTEVATELSETSEQPVTRKAVERLVANARVNLSAAFARVASGEFCEEQQQLLELVDKGWATPEQEREASDHLQDCPQCAQVRAFDRFERNAGLAAITLPGFGAAAPEGAVTGLLASLQGIADVVADRARDIATRLWPFSGGGEAGGAAMGGVTTTKAVVAICVAAGGTGACVDSFSPKAPETVKPAAVKEQRQAPEQVAYAPVSEVAQPSEASASVPVEAVGQSTAGERQSDSKPPAHTRRLARTSNSPPSASAPQSEFGFEGSPAPSAGGGKASSATSYSGGGSAVAVTSSTTLSSDGGESEGAQAPSPTPSSPAAAPSGGSSGGSASRSGEFSFAP